MNINIDTNGDDQGEIDDTVNEVIAIILDFLQEKGLCNLEMAAALDQISMNLITAAVVCKQTHFKRSLASAADKYIYN